MESKYSQNEVDLLVKQALLEQQGNDFVDKTKADLAHIAVRLDRANGYKETFGRDITQIKNQIQDLTTKAQLIVPEEQVNTLINMALQRRVEQRQRYWGWIAGIAVGAAATLSVSTWFLTNVLHLIK